MSKVITREQYQGLADLFEADRDFNLTDADFDVDGDGHVSETEFHATFDAAIDMVSTTISHPNDQAFDETDIEEFKTSLTYNKFKQWGQFFAESPSETLSLRDDLSADFGHSLIQTGHVNNYEFQGATEAAEVMMVSRGAQRVPIYAPDRTKNIIEDEVEISDALNEIDPDVIPLVHSVTINPVPNPDDSMWQIAYNNMGLVSYMNSGATGEITVFPEGQDPLWTHITMQHEIGHVWSMGRWTSVEGSVHWKTWETATEQDGAAPTSYAKSSLLEDFAESFALYLYFRNNREASEDAMQLRNWFPELFKRLDATGFLDYTNFSVDYFSAFAKAFPNRFAILQEIANNELTGPFALDSKQWEAIHVSYAAAERFEKDGNLDLAARECEKILAIDANQNEAKRLLCGYECIRGNDAKSTGAKVIHYQKAYDTYPTYPGLKEALADSYMNNGHESYSTGSIDRAIGDYERAYRLCPELPNLKENMGFMYFKRGTDAYKSGDVTTALSSFEKISTLYPTDPDNVANMIFCHKILAAQTLAQVRNADAKMHYEAVLKLDPNDAEAANYVNGVTRDFVYHDDSNSL